MATSFEEQGFIRDKIRPLREDEDPSHLNQLLVEAIKGRYTKSVKILLDNRNVNPNLPDDGGSTPIFHTTDLRANPPRNQPLDFGMEALTALLESKKVDKNHQDEKGRTVLSVAVEKENLQVVKILLGYSDIDLNHKDKSGQTPLSKAVESGNVEIVKVLLEKLKEVVDLFKIDEEGDGKDDRVPPISRALETGNPDITAMALNMMGEHPLRRLVHLGRLKSIQGSLDAISRKPSLRGLLHEKDEHGRTALHLAVDLGSKAIAEELLNHRAEVNAKDKKGITPLNLAMKSKRSDRGDTIELLLGRSASLDALKAEAWREAIPSWSGDALLVLSEEARLKAPRPANNQWGQSPTPPPPKRSHKMVRSMSDAGNFTVGKRLVLCLEGSRLPRPPAPEQARIRDRRLSEIVYDDLEKYIFVTATVPGPELLHAKDLASIETSQWNRCEILWTKTTPPPTDGKPPKTEPIEFYSMLPYGWVPSDGTELFGLFLDHLKDRWLGICNMARQCLSNRREAQLKNMGQELKFVRKLAEDARKLAELRGYFRDQVSSGRNALEQHDTLPDVEPGVNINKMADFARAVEEQLNELDQIVRDLLHLEFAWVAVNEAHHSTSLATSIKRLSWITFIFLPVMFASSLFGMNVDILRDNPDWRWFLLFAVVSLILAIIGWLVFKYSWGAISSPRANQRWDIP
ncbi:ankyrin repeat-containing domain protein [Phialemonium atrogriseum]|uniref:Ankyrin repeat-containing domain protein n=1 Tax=Phialemonium atrogriseum TaxID=1093897 RepID=A0AAJ0BVG0_9PEZI|nr:ankyrin repeat-containing domain protein [Phialemonium atrogriseum]KAK1765215.1 ankyrin repeat-containing domain protein [Phialemonium atrogriseum]